MYKEWPTLTWGYVQTRERRDKRCPQYRVLGSLPFRKDSEFGSLKSWLAPPLACSLAQWFHVPFVFGCSAFCPGDVLHTISEYFQDNTYFIDGAANHSVLQGRFFVVSPMFFVVQVHGFVVS